MNCLGDFNNFSPELKISKVWGQAGNEKLFFDISKGLNKDFGLLENRQNCLRWSYRSQKTVSPRKIVNDKDSEETSFKLFLKAVLVASGKREEKTRLTQCSPPPPPNQKNKINKDGYFDYFKRFNKMINA